MDNNSTAEASPSGGDSSKEDKRGGADDGIAAMDTRLTIPSSAPVHIERHPPSLTTEVMPVVKFLSFNMFGMPREKKYSAPLIPFKVWSSTLRNCNETQEHEKRYIAMKQVKKWTMTLRKGGKIKGQIKNFVDIVQMDNLMLKHWDEFADALLYHCQLYDRSLSSIYLPYTGRQSPLTSVAFYGIPMQHNLCNVLVPTLSHASIDNLAFNFCRLDSKEGIEFLSQILETNSNVRRIAIQNWMIFDKMNISITNESLRLCESPNSDIDLESDYNFHFFSEKKEVSQRF